jgi:hypothetical protein
VHFDLLAEVTRDRDLLQAGGAVLDDRDMQAVLIENNRVGRYDHRWRLARDQQLDGTIDPGTECAVRIGDVGKKSRPTDKNITAPRLSINTTTTGTMARRRSSMASLCDPTEDGNAPCRGRIDV